MTRRDLTRWSAILLMGLGMMRVAEAAVIPAKAVVAQILLERAFDLSLVTHRPERPWGWADMAPVARLSLPRLGIDRIVLDSGSGQAMAFGPTLLPGRPNGTTVIAAHRDTHFRFLQQARTGDLFVLKGIDGSTTHYRMTYAEVVRWDRFAIGRDGGPQLALTTCYPFDALGHGPLRYVVHAERVSA